MRIEQGPYGPEYYNSGQEILHLCDLEEEDLAGKKILDIGSGERTLEKYLSDSGVEAEVFSYDKYHQKLTNDQLPNTAVQGELNPEDGSFLPYKDESFDLVVDVWSSVGGLPGENTLPKYLEALRVTKLGGELRLCGPFNRKSGTIGSFLFAFYNNPVPELSDQISKELTKVLDDLREAGGPPEPEDDRMFWENLWKKISKLEQVKITEFWASILQNRLEKLGVNTDIEIVDVAEGMITPDEKGELLYLPSMIIKKIPNEI